MAKPAVAGAKVGFKAFFMASANATIMIFSEIVTIHQALILQNSTICTSAFIK
jgi:hypothetical protein